MKSDRLPVNSFVRIDGQGLQAIIEHLQELSYRIIGPRITDGAIVYGDLEQVEELPVGVVDHQDGGTYRIEQTGTNSCFDFVVGPDSLKRFLFPPRETVLQCDRSNGVWEIQTPELPTESLAVIGPRSCDLHALSVQDRVFLKRGVVDPNYQARRERLFLVAVNCRRAAATCFCHSMKTGPAVSSGFDLALTEMDEFFVVEVGSEIGGSVITAADWTPCSMRELKQAAEVPVQLADEMRRRTSVEGPPESGNTVRQRSLETTDIHDVLMEDLEHARWSDVARRCLSCANCTMVCPTCFCSAVEDVSDLSGDHVSRERLWDSCFTSDHSYMSSGTVRKTIRSRYRQWLTHKLATWHDQFGTSGCTGCGRCITWCPVGIDLTEEVAAIRGGQP